MKSSSLNYLDYINEYTINGILYKGIQLLILIYYTLLLFNLIVIIMEICGNSIILFSYM